MPPTETEVFENQLLTNWHKEQFSKEFCNSEDSGQIRELLDKNVFMGVRTPLFLSG